MFSANGGNQPATEIPRPLYQQNTALHNKSGNGTQKAQRKTQKGTKKYCLCLLSPFLRLLWFVPAFVVQKNSASVDFVLSHSITFVDPEFF
jgi:hypothetical protein